MTLKHLQVDTLVVQQFRPPVRMNDALYFVFGSSTGVRLLTE